MTQTLCEHLHWYVKIILPPSCWIHLASNAPIVFWKVESIRSETEPGGVRSALVPLQNSMPNRDQAETHTTNYKVILSTAGGQSYAHKRFLSLITPHWLLLYCLKVSSSGSENSRGPSTQACTRFFTEVRFTFWKVHQFLWGECIIFNQCWPWTFVVLEKAETIQEHRFYGLNPEKKSEVRFEGTA